MKKTATNIPFLLEQRGHSLKWFCDQIEMHRSYVWMMETGKRPVSTDYLERASRVLNVPEAQLSTECSDMQTSRDRERVAA